MVELGSDVPLREDILRQPEEFTKSELIYRARTGKQFFAQAEKGSVGSSIMVTAGPKEIIFITTLTMCGVGFGGGQGLVQVARTSDSLMKLRIAVTGSISNSITFSMPIKILPNETVKLHGNTSVLCNAEISGWKEDIRLG